MNTEILDLAKQIVREEPTRAIMSVWTKETDRNECKTAGCIAGWLCMIGELKRIKIPAVRTVARLRDQVDEKFWGSATSIQHRAAELLDLPLDNVRSLFHIGRWPDDLRAYASTTHEQTPEFAELMCEAIDRFKEDPESFSINDKGWTWANVVARVALHHPTKVSQ